MIIVNIYIYIHTYIPRFVFCKGWYAQNSAKALCRCCAFCDIRSLASALRRTSQLRVVMESLGSRWQLGVSDGP